MKVHVEGNIYIESDERQFIVREYTGTRDKEGREIQKDPRYFTSFNGCLKYLLNKELRDSTVSDLKELKNELRRIEEVLANI